MKKLTHMAVAVGLASGLIAGQASAAIDFSLSVDDPSIAGAPDPDIPSDGNSQTGNITQLDLNDINPVSIYYDTDGTAGLSTGDLVIDVARAFVDGLNPLALADNEGFSAYWGIEIDWLLVGAAILTPDGLFGAFGDGTVTFDVTNLPGTDATNFSEYAADFVAAPGVPVPELTIDITGSALTSDGIGLDLFGEVVQADAGFARVESGQFAGSDFADLAADTLVELKATGITTLEDADNVPTALADGQSLADYFAAIDGGDAYDATVSAYLAGIVAAFEASAGLTDEQIDSKLLRTTRLASPVIRFDVPAPATLGLLGLGLLGLGSRARKRS